MKVEIMIVDDKLGLNVKSADDQHVTASAYVAGAYVYVASENHAVVFKFIFLFTIIDYHQLSCTV